MPSSRTIGTVLKTTTITAIFQLLYQIEKDRYEKVDMTLHFIEFW